MKTFLAKKETVQPKWHLIDAQGVVLGRLAVKAANLIRGRHKATYTPSVDTGDYVVVINAEKVALTGKKEVQNKYMFFSGFVGGESYRKLTEQRERHPEFLIEHAVKGMLVSVRGRLHNTRWTDGEGVERFGYEIIADDVQFLNRPRKGDAGEPADQGELGDDDIPF